MLNNLCPVYGRIYLITNLVNGKRYVGQTTFSAKHRFRTHFNNAKHDQGWDNYFYRSLRKYGKENFSIREMCVCYSKLELDLMEDLYIAALDTMNKDTGYNIKRGGSNGKFSEESLLRMSLVKKGKKKSEETRRRMREAQALRRATEVPQETRPETRLKMSLMRRGKKCYKYRHDVDTEFIKLLYLGGYGSGDIAFICSIHSDTVVDRLRKGGITLDPHRRNRRKPLIH